MSESRQIARRFLNGVGDASLGEWEEEGGGGIVHVRRRLSVAEMDEYGVTEVRDIRGTPEEQERFHRLLEDVPSLRRVLAGKAPDIGGL